MLHDFVENAGAYGLKLNFDKTLVMTWDHYRHNCSEVRVCHRSIKVLGEDAAEKYLGRRLALANCCQVEIESRIGAAWCSFHKHKQELCCKHYRLQDRCRLFDATVTPTLLYGCAAWALTGNLERDLKVQRRRMLRYVFVHESFGAHLGQTFVGF